MEWPKWVGFTCYGETRSEGTLVMSQETAARTARWPVVDTGDAIERGQAIKQRRLDVGIGTVKEFARATTRLGNRDVRGVSVSAITAAEKGEASERTYERLESWLDRFEEDYSPGEESPPEPEVAVQSEGGMDVVEFHIDAIGVTVKGPVANLDELRSAVEKLIRGTTRDD